VNVVGGKWKTFMDGVSKFSEDYLNATEETKNGFPGSDRLRDEIDEAIKGTEEVIRKRDKRMEDIGSSTIQMAREIKALRDAVEKSDIENRKERRRVRIIAVLTLLAALAAAVPPLIQLVWPALFG